jgi:hypothetical protein
MKLVVFVVTIIISLNSCAEKSLERTIASGTNTENGASQETGDITGERFTLVKRAFEGQGARVERDFTSYRGQTVRIYLPASVAIDITKTQAETIAATARSQLGGNAIVYIKGPGGNTLGKASSFD